MNISDNHKWLLDFCGYYNGEEENPFNERLQQNEQSNSRISSELEHQLQVSRMFWYYEECWVKFTLNMECGFSYCGEYLRDQLEDFLKDNGTPITLKALLHNRFFHWSGGYDTVDGFKQWYIDNYEKYRDRSRQNKLSKGKRILNEYRLEFFMYKADWQELELTADMDYRFNLANSVDGDHTYDTPIDEETMCKALEYAAENDCKIEIVPDDCCRDRVDGWTYHIEFQKNTF